MRPNIEQENEFYINCLFDKEIGKVARIYLNKRGITKETAKFWKLGYSPINIINPIFDINDNFKPWIKLQGRITIPIYNQNDELISISGRLIKKLKNKPKYDHYPFPSRSTLFGLSQNKMNIFNEDRCFVTEGQMDVISSWQAGVTNIVSSFGAHLSLNHLALISRYTNNIDIIYDNDFAGYNGANKVKEFKNLGDLNLNILRILKEGEDLDSFFKKNKKEDFYNLINNNNQMSILQKKLQYIKNFNNL